VRVIPRQSLSWIGEISLARGAPVAARWSLISILLLVTLFPIFWMLATSLKPDGEMTNIPPQWIPAPITSQHYVNVVARQIPFFRYLLNSVIVASGVTILATFTGTLAAYGFSRYPIFRSNSLLLVFFLAGQMFPGVMLVIPSFVLLKNLHLLDSRFGLILANTSLVLPFTIYMLNGFFDTLPRELEEAARIDGCSRIQAFLHVAVPLTMPGIVATAFMAFVIAWDDYVLALQLIISDDKKTLPVGIVSSLVGQLGVKWGDMMAASVLMSLPVVIFFVFVQRRLIEGLTAGAIKG
jgi:multiple sugar transport system permease protein